MPIPQLMLEQTGVIAIIRGVEANKTDALVTALYDGGIRLAEITMNTANATETILRLRGTYYEKMCIGAGTVTDVKRAAAAIDAGAQFIVTPNTNADVISLCLKNNIMIIPGALTPTEIVSAINLGCEYVKLFPASSMGPKYLKDILAPIDNAKIVAVGGVSIDNATEYLKNGACAIGVGGNLCKVPENGEFAEVTQLARQLVEIYLDSLK